MQNQIHASAAFVKLLKLQDGSFPVTSRGKTQIKGKGLMETFWIFNDQYGKMASKQQPTLSWQMKRWRGGQGSFRDSFRGSFRGSFQNSFQSSVHGPSSPSKGTPLGALSVARTQSL